MQTIVNDLNRKVVGRRITGVWFDWPKMLKDPLDQQRNKVAHKHAAVFEKVIKGKKILGIRRRAKNLLFALSDNLMMLIHLKMTGHLLVGKWKVKREKRKEIVIPLEPKEAIIDPYNGYIHLIFYLDNGKMLAFSDLRKFGKVILGTKEQIEHLPEIEKLGPEPLDRSFKLEKFVKLIKSEKRKIKQVLMDQEVIAGIGNIYSDDILWKARIYPLKPANKLSPKELREIWKAMHEVLQKGLKLRGTSISDYRDTAGKEGSYDKVRLVYQREGESCPRCRIAIKRIKLGGRSAHYCPTCQKP